MTAITIMSAIGKIVVDFSYSFVFKLVFMLGNLYSKILYNLKFRVSLQGGSFLKKRLSDTGRIPSDECHIHHAGTNRPTPFRKCDGAGSTPSVGAYNAFVFPIYDPPIIKL